MFAESGGWPRIRSKTVTRPRGELLENLQEQIGYLERSNEAFDNGHLAEAKRLSVPLRVLFHQTRNSHALINQLGLEKVLTWVDTAGVPRPGNLVSTTGLTLVRMVTGPGAHAEHVAQLDFYPPSPILTRGGQEIPPGTRIPFDEWWNNPVIRDTAGTEFSRRAVVLALANKEGGAHVDPVADADYSALASSSSLGVVFKVNDEELTLANPVLPSIRQVSYEVLESLREQQQLIV